MKIICILLLLTMLFSTACRRTSKYPHNETTKIRTLVPDKARVVRKGYTQNKVINAIGFPDEKISVFADGIHYHVWVYTTKTDQVPPEDYFMKLKPESAMTDLDGIISMTGKRWKYSDFDRKALDSFSARYVLVWSYVFFRKERDGLSRVAHTLEETEYILAGINDREWDRSCFCQILIDESLTNRISQLAKDVNRINPPYKPMQEPDYY